VSAASGAAAPPDRPPRALTPAATIVVVLVGIGVGALVGALVPAVAGVPDAVLLVVIAIAIGITLLDVPLASFGRAVLDRRFLAAVLLLNLVVSPLLVYVLSRIVFRDPDLQAGLLLMLLAPGVGLVAAFVRRAGGAVETLLSVAPVLLLLQAITVPGFMLLFTAGENFLSLDGSRLPIALFVGILAPALVVTGLQLAGVRAPRLASALRRGSTLTAPATALAAGLVAAVMIPRAIDRLDLLEAVAPLFGVYLIVMTPVGILVGTAFGLSISSVRSLTFSGGARNGLLVLPIALAFPEGFALVAVVVVLGMAIEVVGMGIYRLVVPSVTAQSRSVLTPD
jgi:ACR3 family arsenite efflux pump ArsB